MNRKLNILHVAIINGVLSNGLESAVQKHVENQSKYANVSLLNCGTSEMKEEQEKYKIYFWKDIKGKKIIESIEKSFGDIDLIVFHGVYYIQFIEIAQKAKKREIPYIIVPHCSLEENAQKKKKFKKIIGNILLFNNFIKRANSIQYLCEGEEKNSVNKNNNYIISGNGIYLTNQKKDYEKCNKDHFEMIYIGRYDIYHKGLDLLIETVYDMQDYMRKNKIILSLYGKEQGDNFEEYVKKFNLSDIVYYHGPIYGEEKIKRLLESDIFIQTSRLEGQPLGVMEAISLGIPCVLTKETNLGELVEEQKIGWMSSFNKEDLQDNIKQAYNTKEEFVEYSKRAVEYAKENFPWEKVSKGAVDKYEKILEQKNEVK